MDEAKAQEAKRIRHVLLEIDHIMSKTISAEEKLKCILAEVKDEKYLAELQAKPRK